MKKAVVLGSTLWLLCGVAGCSSDDREKLIKEVIETMRGAAETLGTVKTLVNDAVASARKSGKPLTAADLKKAENEANNALKLGKKLQQLRLLNEGRREGTTDEQRKEWHAKYQGEVE